MILGIDPGKTGAYCVNDKYALVYGKLNTHDCDELCELALYVKRGWALFAYVEDVHMQASKFNARVLLAHAKAIGKTEGVLWSHGIKVILVPASTWQSALLGKTKDTKAASIQFAASLGVITKNHNIADAVCLAHYGATAQRLGIK